MVSVRYDPEVNVLYVKLVNKKQRILKSIPLGEGRYVDVTNDNIPAGIEFILPKSMPKEAMKVLCKLPKSKL